MTNNRAGRELIFLYNGVIFFFVEDMSFFFVEDMCGTKPVYKITVLVVPCHAGRTIDFAIKKTAQFSALFSALFESRHFPTKFR